MGLIKLGDFIELSEFRNSDNHLGEKDVIGISTSKEFINTKADLENVNFKSYKIVNTGYFAYVADTSRRGDKISLAYNNTKETYLVSSISTVFRVKLTEFLLPDFLYIYFNRPEFDRYSRFHSWGSARETFSWEEMCNLEIELPSIEIQQKYVDIYRAMKLNQQSYEIGLEDLKLTCDAYIEKLQKLQESVPIGKYLKLCELRNENNLTVESVRGLAVSKEMIPTKADMDGVGLKNYKVVKEKEIAFVPDTSRRGDKISLAMNNTGNDVLVSSISVVFATDKDNLLPEYLMLFFSKSEFDRYARFHSWGSARETFSFEEMCNVKIPIPKIEIQQAIVDIYTAYQNRKEINERLKLQIKDICPILIKDALEEGAKG